MNRSAQTQTGSDPFRSLQILDELSQNDSLTQRDLSKRLGIALGLVNSYIKNLIAKGYVTVTTIPPKRYAYYLTPTGFAEKTRLTYRLLQDYTRIYREARRGLQSLFRELEGAGKTRVVFAGTDEVAEIAYLTLQETKIALVGVIDLETRASFFGKPVGPIASLRTLQYDCVVVVSYLHRDAIRRALLREGADRESIREVF